MRSIKICCLCIALFLLEIDAQVSQVILSEGSSIEILVGNEICADFIIVNSGANLIAEDSSCICQDAVVSGSGDISLPVELVSFSAAIKSNRIELSWRTESEENNYGFDIEMKTGEKSSWEKIDFVKGFGNSNKTNIYSYVVKDEIAGGNQFFRLKQIDNSGNFSYSNEIEVSVLPDDFNLSQNYPNPFNPVTRFSYSIPEISNVKIEVVNLIGQTVKLLLNREIEAGKYFLNWNAADFASGVYLIRMNASSEISGQSYVKVVKALLMK